MQGHGLPQPEFDNNMPIQYGPPLVNSADWSAAATLAQYNKNQETNRRLRRPVRPYGVAPTSKETWYGAEDAKMPSTRGERARMLGPYPWCPVVCNYFDRPE
jgi:hypothetical protein